MTAFMIIHKADRQEIERLAIIGASNLFHFRECGQPVTCKWEPGIYSDLTEPDATVATFEAKGVKPQPANWQGVRLLALTGWRLTTPKADWERMTAVWRMGIGLECPPHEMDFLHLEAKEKGEA